RCEKTEKLTYHKLVELVTENNIVLNVHPSIAENYQKCKKCNKHAETLFHIDDEQICIECVDANYSECDCCKKFVKDSDLYEPSIRDICVDCVNKGHDPLLESDDLIQDLVNDIN